MEDTVVTINGNIATFSGDSNVYILRMREENPGHFSLTLSDRDNSSLRAEARVKGYMDPSSKWEYADEYSYHEPEFPEILPAVVVVNDDRRVVIDDSDKTLIEKAQNASDMREIVALLLYRVVSNERRILDDLALARSFCEEEDLPW